jgi:hypothetical protein
MKPTQSLTAFEPHFKTTLSSKLCLLKKLDRDFQIAFTCFKMRSLPDVPVWHKFKYHINLGLSHSNCGVLAVAFAKPNRHDCKFNSSELDVFVSLMGLSDSAATRPCDANSS